MSAGNTIRDVFLTVVNTGFAGWGAFKASYEAAQAVGLQGDIVTTAGCAVFGAAVGLGAGCLADRGVKELFKGQKSEEPARNKNVYQFSGTLDVAPEETYGNDEPVVVVKMDPKIYTPIGDIALKTIPVGTRVTGELEHLGLNRSKITQLEISQPS